MSVAARPWHTNRLALCSIGAVAGVKRLVAVQLKVFWGDRKRHGCVCKSLKEGQELLLQR